MWPFHRADKLAPFVCRLSGNSRVSKLLGPEGLVLACNGTALPSDNVEILLAKTDWYLRFTTCVGVCIQAANIEVFDP
jgi:hypothetical protein